MPVSRIEAKTSRPSGVIETAATDRRRCSTSAAL
jgi:hypothetical protein